MEIRKILYNLAFFMMLLLAACGESVVDIDFKDPKNPKLVVEGTIDNIHTTHTIKLSQTTGIKSKQPVFVEDALVILEDSNGFLDTLTYTEKGNYVINLQGTPGSTYTLRINHNENWYEATSSMPHPARIDSIGVKYIEESEVRTAGYYVYLINVDAHEQLGYYRCRTISNAISAEDREMQEDFFSYIDRTNNNIPLNYLAPFTFKHGDTLTIKTTKMDREVYRYYQGLLEIYYNDGGLLGPVPSNPPSNISNGAIGVFQAIAITETTVHIK